MMLIVKYSSVFYLVLLTILPVATEVEPPKPLTSGSPVFQRNPLGGILSLSTAFLDDLGISEYCVELLHVFDEKYVTLANCIVSSALPVKMCQNCYPQHNEFLEIYFNISDNKMGPGNVTCERSLMRSNRLMLLYNLYSGLDEIWQSAACAQCLTTGEKSLSNDTLYFLDYVNKSLSCFEKYQQSNHSDLCKECKPTYKNLSEVYSTMAKNKHLCIDVEDAMNVTRQFWSKTYNCSVPREETVPVIAVSSFMIFLPVIFYLSNYLHSEQKKRKLIQPKRAKSSNSLMNIQDKFS